MNLKELHPKCLLVKELIEELQKCDPEGEVRFLGNGYNGAMGIESVREEGCTWVEYGVDLHHALFYPHITSDEERTNRIKFFEDLKTKVGRQVVGVFGADGKEIFSDDQREME